MQLDSTPHSNRFMPERMLPPQQLAHNLMVSGPSHGWNKYGGLDETLRINIDIAEDCAIYRGRQGVLDYYGTATIASEMKALQCALNVLAKHGPDLLMQQGRDALAMGLLTLDALIRHSVTVSEANFPGSTTGIYSKSRHFGHYLVEAQKVISTICYALDIQEIQQRTI